MSVVTATDGHVRPPVTAADVRIGAYFADPRDGRLLRVADIHGIDRGLIRTRIAMLEDAVTEQLEPWEFGDVRRLRVVRRVDG